MTDEDAKQKLAGIKRRLVGQPLRKLIDFAAYVVLEHGLTAGLDEPDENELYLADMISEAAEYAELDLDAASTTEGGRA